MWPRPCNASAVARWLRPFVDEGRPVAVVAAGERWPDGSLRPAVEDLWGAGAVLDALLGADAAPDVASPEAELAAAAFRATREDLAAALHRCASGHELVGVGCEDDVAIAAELDVAQVVPVLREGEFRDAALSVQ